MHPLPCQELWAWFPSWERYQPPLSMSSRWWPGPAVLLYYCYMIWNKARIFFISWLKFDLQDYFFSDLGSGEGKRKKKALKITSQSSENNQLTGHFQSFFLCFWPVIFQFLFFYWSFSEPFFFKFFNISRTNSKTGKVNQQSVLNL